ncbi:hypothetical protein EMCRGX_G023502 [Ephydatia muelleri]
MDRISTGTGLNPGGQPSNRQRDRIGKTRSLFVRQRDRVDPVRLAVNVTGSIIADRGITEPNVSDLSLLHQLLQTLHGLFDGSAGVHAVLVVEVYVICAQPLEGIRQLGPDQLRFTGRCGCKGDAKLGSDDEFVSSDEERTVLLQKAGISSTIAIGAAEVLVCPTGLHITLGIFTKMFNLLEAVCCNLDLELALHATDVDSSSFSKYSLELQNLPLLQAELEEAQQAQEKFQHMWSWLVVQREIHEL